MKRPWCWERLKTGGEADDWEWDVWMASLTQCPLSWWWAGRSGMVQTMKSQSVRHDWVFELNWCLCINIEHLFSFWEKAMAPCSSTLAWNIPWTEEAGRLQSMRLLRVRYDWATSLSFFTFMSWRRTWQPTPVFLPGESQGWGSLMGCRLWGHTELDTAEVT